MKKSLLVASLLLSAAAHAVCPAGTEEKGSISSKPLCSLKGKYLGADLVLTNDNHYLIDEGVFIGGDNKDNSTLRIQAGTVVHGTPGAFISIMRGSKIFAEGTKTQPILFTALSTSGRKKGEWGGLVINGNAPINACKAGVPVCEAVSEGIKVEPVKFGGNDRNDNSGILKYVKVEFAGYPISQDNELNGITFNAVGAGTTVDYVQVHMNADDGVEFFGGTVNVKHLVLTANEDDSLDWDMGWTGKVQFLMIDQGTEVSDNGFEADNLKSPMNAEPRSNPEISNFTLIGSPTSAFGMLLRRGTAANLKNGIITGFAKACINIDDSETFVNGGNGQGTSVVATGLSLKTTVLNCAKNFQEETTDSWSIKSWFLAQEGNQEVDAKLNGWVPTQGSPALGLGVTPDDFFFDPVDYSGAVVADDNWTLGWVTTPKN